MKSRCGKPIRPCVPVGAGAVAGLAGLTVVVTVVLLAEPVRPATSLGGVVSLPGGGGSFSSGAVHGAAGPAIAAAPFSKIVDSVDGRTGSSQMPRDSDARARSM